MVLVEYFEAEQILKKYGIKSIKSSYVKSAQDAITFGDGDRIVLKAISQNALHKSKSGLVEVGMSSKKEITAAYLSLVKKASKYGPYKILAQKMASGGIEIIIGGNTDEQFGKLILLGLGGIYVEAFRDFSLRVCPIDKKEAGKMIDQLKSKNIIAKDSKQRELIEELLVKVSKMFSAIDIKELDLNPLILHDGTYDAVDLRMIK